MTHAQGDRGDLYREKIRPGERPLAMFRDEWQPLRRREETFAVKGEADTTSTFWETRHGPVVAGDPTRDDEVVAFEWALAGPAHDFDALLKILTATSVDEAREGFRTLDSISGNFCCADVQGNIAYQYTGRVPKRPPRLLPVPGWDGEHEWDGNVPKEELPSEVNPAAGVIVTANNKTTTPDYPHHLAYVVTPYRADRLRELMDNVERFSPEDMRALQADQTSVHARELARHLTAHEASTADARELQDLLRNWAGTMAIDSAAALVYTEACQQLVQATVHRYYGKAGILPSFAFAEDRRILLGQVAADRRLMLGEFPSWQACFDQTLDDAAKALRARYGDEPAAWRYGAAHRMGWRHNLGRRKEWAGVFNLPDVEIGGDGFTVCNTQTAYGTAADFGVSFRQIFDLRDLNAAQICIPPGNSGQPGSAHYGDNVERWRDVQYHPLYVRWADIEANAEAELLLTPAG
jgi:penicillin amidase